MWWIIGTDFRPFFTSLVASWSSEKLQLIEKRDILSVLMNENIFICFIFDGDGRVPESLPKGERRAIFSSVGSHQRDDNF